MLQKCFREMTQVGRGQEPFGYALGQTISNEVCRCDCQSICKCCTHFPGEDAWMIEVQTWLRHLRLKQCRSLHIFSLETLKLTIQERTRWSHTKRTRVNMSTNLIPAINSAFQDTGRHCRWDGRWEILNVVKQRVVMTNQLKIDVLNMKQNVV